MSRDISLISLTRRWASIWCRIQLILRGSSATKFKTQDNRNWICNRLTIWIGASLWTTTGCANTSPIWLSLDVGAWPRKPSNLRSYWKWNTTQIVDRESPLYISLVVKTRAMDSFAHFFWIHPCIGALRGAHQPSDYAPGNLDTAFIWIPQSEVCPERCPFPEWSGSSPVIAPTPVMTLPK